MDIVSKGSEDKSIDWLDLEFWPESDFKVERMQDNQAYGWLPQQLDDGERQQSHAQHHLASAVSQDLGPTHTGFAQYSQQRGDATAGISGVRACFCM